MNKRTLILTALLATSAHAEGDWIEIARLEDGTNWSFRKDSFEFSKNKSGDSIALVIGKHVSPQSGKVFLQKYYVTAKDCARKIGKLVTLNIDGTYEFENDFAFEAGNVASSMAETICLIGIKKIQNNNEKSL